MDVELESLLRDFDLKHGNSLSSGKCILAVSGGVDSMVLAQLLLNCNFPFSMAHVNFGLRGIESDADENFVREFAYRNQIQLFVYKPDTREFATDNGLSVQMAARELRYTFFRKCLRENDLKYIITAHHANDLLEHFFIYLVRNSPATAWKGIPEESGDILRPLLRVGKEQILEFANTNEMQWREDSSNQKDDYLRNRIRHMIIPGILHHYPKVLEEFYEISSRLRKEFEKQQRWFEDICRNFISDEKEIRIDKKILDSDAGKQALKWYLRSKGFSNDNSIRIAEHAQTGNVFYAESLRLVSEHDQFVIYEGLEQESPYRFYVQESELPELIHAGAFEIQIKTGTEKPDKYEENEWYFDAEDVEFPLCVRSWSEGDKMKLFGSEHSKKISDIFVDAKIGVMSKRAFPVIESAGNILGVLALRRAAAAPLEPHTQRVLRIKWQKSGSSVK